MSPGATRFKQRCTRLIPWLLIAPPVIWIGAAWLAAREITRPTRRPLQDYHQVILNAPASHGITITPFTLSDGTPTLLCRPASSGTLDQRGTLLRSQLQQRNLTLPPTGIENNATLVLLHGRRGRKEDLLPIAVRFCATGFRCLLIDLPAHGDNPSPVATFGPNEAPLPLKALKALKALTEAATKFNFPARPAGLWGMSMGGSVAIHATAATPALWDSLIIVASFDQLAPVIHRQSTHLLGSTLGTPLYATLKPFFKRQSGIPLDQIQPASLAPKITCPTLIAHGDDDPLIPLASARHLFDAIGTPTKSFVNVGSGTHGNVLITPHPLYADMTAWFLSHLVR
jgi:alpha-beta hydrolase superfamily lysophospholipase